MTQPIRPKNDMTARDYTPDETRRFSLSDDDITKGRIAALAEIRKYIENEWQIPVYFIIYGSIVKGRELKNVRESDVDFSIFYDLTDVDITSYLSHHHVPESDDRSSSERIADAILFAVKAKMRNKGMNDEQLDNIWIYEISEDILERNLKAIDLTNNNFRKDLALQPVVRMFYFDIGNSFNHWKLRVAEKLKEMGEQGEKMWSHIIAFVIDQERGGDVSEELISEYPQTIEEALAKYSPNTSIEQVR